MSHVKDTNATKTKNEKTKVIIEKNFLTISSPPWGYYSIKAEINQCGALYIIRGEATPNLLPITSYLLLPKKSRIKRYLK